MEEKIVKKPLRHTAKFIGGIINGLFILIYILAMLSPYLSPRVSQIPAFLNLGFILILPLLVIFWLYHLICRNWRYFSVYSAMTLLSLGYILNYFPLHTGKSLTANRDIRIMTYNVCGLTYKDPDTGERLAARFITEKGADIVALQEAYLNQKGISNEQALQKIFGKQYPYIHSAHRKSQALLSKYKILAIEEIEYPTIGNGSHAYILQLPNHKKMLLVNNHMESYVLKENELNRYKEYVKNFQIKQIPKQILEIKRRLGPKLNQRAYAAKIVNEEMEKLCNKYEPDYVVVLGDLNDTPMSYTYQQVKAGYRDAFSETGFGISASFNEPFMPFRIDHLFYGGPLKAIGSSIPVKKSYSDHNPLIVDFEFQDK
ncbi:endonuclease/exonuclease/phosphatase family protein [Porphyromonadaceae bacterium W3.11]|nr:endonuclease/exonuclease/phosphatase family protein [Porphyromonadaceae bacterium W3.11]